MEFSLRSRTFAAEIQMSWQFTVGSFQSNTANIEITANRQLQIANSNLLCLVN